MTGPKEGLTRTPRVDERRHRAIEHSHFLLAAAACWPIAGSSLILLVDTALPNIRVLPSSLGTAMVYAALVYALLRSLRLLLSLTTLSVVLITVALPALLATTMLLDDQHANFYIVLTARLVLTSLPWLLVANAVEEYGRLRKYLYRAAIIVLLAGCVRLFLPDPSTVGDTTYSQYAGYQVLPAAVIFADAMRKRRWIINALLLAGSIVLIVAAGARGPVVAILIYLVLRAVITFRHRAIAGLVCVGGLAVTIVLNWVPSLSLNALSRLFESYGLSTRIIDRFSAGDFLDDSTRFQIASRAWELIMKHPAMGVGPGHDRILMAGAMGQYDPSTAAGWYPHNIVLELMLQFGVFLGGGLVIAIVILVGRAAIDRDRDLQRTVLIFVAIGLVPLLISGSYLIQPAFFALMGFCLAARRRTEARPQAHAVSDAKASGG